MTKLKTDWILFFAILAMTAFGIVMVYSVFLLAFNLLVDIGYVFLDPRIDLSARGR